MKSIFLARINISFWMVLFSFPVIYFHEELAFWQGISILLLSFITAIFVAFLVDDWLGFTDLEDS